jgi:HK97 family phage portal protein
MGLINRAVAAVWQLPSAIRAAPRTTPADPGDRVIYVGRTPAGLWVTPEEALKLSTVWACVTVISKALASCQWEVLEEDTDGNRTPRRDLPLSRRLNVAPNPEMTAFSFREAMLIQALLWGNAFAEIERNMRGDAVALWPLDPARVCFDRLLTGELALEVQNTQGKTILPYRDVFHLHGPSINGLEGLSIAHVAARTFGHAAAAEIFGATFYSNGTQMGGILSTEAGLTQQQRDDLLKSITERHSGPENANKFLLLQGGLKYQQLSPTQEQSQFIETRTFMVAEICRFFGVPPHKVGELTHATFSNIEHQGLEFVRDALTPWAERMAQEASAKLLPFGNRRLTTRFQIDWMAEGDSASRAEADAKYVGAGIRTRNEVRSDHGWNSLPEGGNLTVQKQYAPIHLIEELTEAEIAKTKAPAPPAATPRTSEEDEAAPSG